MPLTAAANATYFVGSPQNARRTAVSMQPASPTLAEAQAMMAVRPVTLAFVHYRDRAAAFRKRPRLPHEAPGYDDVLFP
jgi:hypothetical protein